MIPRPARKPARRPRVLATICGRGGSKGVAGKNVRVLNGKPLIQYTLECAAACPSVGDVVVSTDNDEILEVVRSLGYTVGYRRPPEYAQDTSAKIDAIRHAVEYVEGERAFFPELIVDLDIGVPMRSPEDVEAVIAKLAADPRLDALVTVYQAERNPYFNMVEATDEGFFSLVKTPEPPVVRRQDAPQVYSITPAVFAWRRESLHITHLYEGRWGIHEMPIGRSIDIDTEHEFRLVQFLMREDQGK